MIIKKNKTQLKVIKARRKKNCVLNSYFREWNEMAWRWAIVACARVCTDFNQISNCVHDRYPLVDANVYIFICGVAYVNIIIIICASVCLCVQVSFPNGTIIIIIAEKKVRSTPSHRHSSGRSPMIIIIIITMILL